MLLTIPFHSGDKGQLVKLATHIRNLGPYPTHICMLWHDHTTDASGILDQLEDSFLAITAQRIPDTDASGWPQGPNRMFERAARHIEHFKMGPWLLLEPDAIPIRKGWLDEIEAEYRDMHKPFMGAMVSGATIPTHMSGVAVYPENASYYFPDALNCTDGAWDVQCHENVKRHGVHWTKLIQFDWKIKGERRGKQSKDLIAEQNGELQFPNLASLSAINPETLVYHQNKDGSLIDRLTEGGKIEEMTAAPVGKPLTASEPVEAIAILDGPKTGSLSSPARTPVFTYFDKVPDIRNHEELIEIWKENWSKFGWEPRVLSRKHAPKSILEPWASQFATTNPREYETACFMRWEAMSNIGGGLMVDYDVMNRGFTPEMLENLSDQPVYIGDRFVPCFVNGTAQAYAAIVGAFSTYGGNQSGGKGTDHVSDMILIKDYLKEGIHYKSGAVVGEFHKDSNDWKGKKLVHFATAWVGVGPSNKTEEIRRLMKELEQEELAKSQESAPKIIFTKDVDKRIRELYDLQFRSGEIDKNRRREILECLKKYQLLPLKKYETRNGKPIKTRTK